MKFYNREKEIATLRDFEEISKNSAQMTMLLGRRRVGKTTLLKNAFAASTALYFFVAKKNEILLCDEFTRETEEKLGIVLGSFQNFASLFKALMVLSQTRNFTLIVDEIQEFANSNPSIFSDIQNIWDSYKDNSQINIVFCGSIYSMMKRIFENSKEPLFGRLTAKITLKPFDIQTIKQILQDFHPKYTNEDLLAFYMVTGGIAKYIEQLVINKAFTKKKILDVIFREGSFFLDEGKAVLIDEFGKDYGNYFSILSLIASSKTDRGDMESTLQIAVGGFLDKLEKDYGLIKRNRPFGAKESSRFNKYLIEDNFLNFWFRFIYKYRSAVEIGNLDYVRNLVERDYETYSGLILEKYFRSQLIDSKQFSAIGSYWDRRGENQIDIIATNELEKRAIIAEVKRQAKNINLNILKNKTTTLTEKLPGYEIEYKGLSMSDM
ncbi:ATPase [Bacteroidia bacterium]|nr:ATPase [Bacteroidia bacterium]